MAFIGAVVLCAAFAAPSQAKNTRVAISDFQWSDPTPEVDLGESVTWDWIGPDLQHSVTGQEENSKQFDSDPGNSNPRHDLGDSFKVTFDAPGQYIFQCKLHISVNGAVSVSNTLGDPNSDPGPQAPLNVDIEPPYVDDIMASPTVYGPKGKGGALTFSTNEAGSADVDYYRLVKKKGKKTRKVFAGYAEWTAYLGINTVPFAKRIETFKAKPGRYEGRFRATDAHNNVTDDFPIQFEIKGKKKKGKKN
ncbi:MAG: cupredoxin domain-containing protein [Solirubrobacterales bacterium]